MKSGRIRIRHHSPFQHHAIRAIGAIVVVGAGFGLYYFGQQSAGFNSIAADEARERLLDSVSQLKEDKIALRDQLALVERSTQVDGQAYLQVKENLKALQQEILELREEVSFYRGIVAPKESSSGLRIDRLEVTKASSERLYHYNLVLTQVLKNHRNVRGTVKLIVEGLQDDRPKKLKMSAVSVEKNKYLEFKFKYFQKFEGDLLLPEGFLPRQVWVEVNAHKRKVVQGSFDWPFQDESNLKKQPEPEVE
ncbi:MAG: hypothetical protein OEX07_04770 [Gammaproteobacteria bacterium]|nr:hypothetical protein [Gammaproteobacteria bacterium]